MLIPVFLTLAERKVIAAMQLRKGPNVVGPWGVLQPFADALKLLVKETVAPSHGNVWIFRVAPIISLTLALITWGVLPFGPGLVIADLELGILYLLAVSSLSVYGTLCSGWASNSKYPFLGALRSTAQMISYEVALALLHIAVILTAGSFNIQEIVEGQFTLPYGIVLFPALIMFYVAALAETNRTPFDLPEGESELVAGYNAEYSSMPFALFFLAEYVHVIQASLTVSLLFLGGWHWGWLSIKVGIVLFIFIWIRASFPRFRYDQLMVLLWKSYLPLSLAFVVFVASLLISFQGFII